MAEWIWQSPEWPGMSAARSQEVEAEILDCFGKLKEMAGRASADDLRALGLRTGALEMSSSMAIESIDVPPEFCGEALDEIMGGRRIEPFAWMARAKNDVPGDPGDLMAPMRSMLDAMDQGKPDLERRMLSWHAALMKVGRNNPGIPHGAWRRTEVGVYGRRGLVYLAPPPDRVLAEMGSFMEMIGKPRGDSILESLETAALAHLAFAVIHPFGDGNGRMARLMDLHCLSRCRDANTGFGPAFSISKEIMESRGHYYWRLQKEQGRREGEIDVSGFLDWHGRMAADAMRESMRFLAGRGIPVPGWKAEEGTRPAMVNTRIEYTGEGIWKTDYDYFIGNTLWKHCDLTEYDEIGERWPKSPCRIRMNLRETGDGFALGPGNSRVPLESVEFLD